MKHAGKGRNDTFSQCYREEVSLFNKDEEEKREQLFPMQTRVINILIRKGFRRQECRKHGKQIEC